MKQRGDSAKQGGSSHGAHFSCEFCTGWWRCQQFIMVERTTNTSLNEKNLSRTVQEIAPLMLELPELHITHGWEHTDISRLQGSCAIHLHPDSEPPPGPALAQQGPSAAVPTKMLSPASSPAALCTEGSFFCDVLLLPKPSISFIKALLVGNWYSSVAHAACWSLYFSTPHGRNVGWLYTYLYVHTPMHSQELL